MLSYIPYTYFIKHIPTGLKYYGSKTANNKHDIANPSNFWVSYFTSSKKVKLLIEKYGKDSFEIQIRKTFKTAEETLNWEDKVLRKLKVLKRQDWINGTIGCKELRAKGPRTLVHNEKISKSHKGKPKSEEHKRKISISKTGRPNNYWRSGNNPSTLHKGKDTHPAKGNKYFSGKKHNEKSKLKMRENNIMKKDNMIAARVRWSDEAKEIQSKITRERNISNRKTWKIEKETGEILLATGLPNFCESYNLVYSSLLYTRKSGKYYRGYKIIGIL